MYSHITEVKVVRSPLGVYFHEFIRVLGKLKIICRQKPADEDEDGEEENHYETVAEAKSS